MPQRELDLSPSRASPSRAEPPARPEPADATTGLSTAEARRRLALHGPNEIAPSHLASRLEQLGKLLLDPMGLMLLGLAALYGILGDHTDAGVLLVAWVPITTVDVVLELRASAALKALRARLRPFAQVLRDGELKPVPTRELVPGDLMAFEEGQALPADGTVVEADHLSVDESALTGESVPVELEPRGDFFGGTRVLAGRGLGRIDKTGGATRYGRIAAMLEESPQTASPLKRKVDWLVRRVLIAATLLAALLLALELLRGNGLVASLIVALTFGMSAVPEEFPLVFTLYLSLGAWRLAKRRVLVKSLPSVEALGSADVLCTDKTGTLTEGRFQLTEILRPNDMDPQLAADALLMACEPRPVDSMEAAIHDKLRDHLPALGGWELVWDYPFEKQGKHMTHVWREKATGRYRTVMKGAVEGVLEHCDATPEERARIEELVRARATRGERLLGLALREGQANGDRAHDERSQRFVAIAVFNDPIRPSAAAAIADCQSAGIEIKMLTGDHPLTAHFVADRAGIRHSHEALYSGRELERMDAARRRQAYIEGAVFSRVLPEQKHEMIEALRGAGRVVAMVGDGINDAPALRRADIGISMGASATDVARSAAQIVLLESDFSGIVSAMLEGRRILSNLKRSFSYLVSFHVPVILLALLPPMLGWPPLLLPIHIIALELVVHPVSAFTFENQSARASPRSEKLLGGRALFGALISGVLVSAAALACYGGLLRVTAPEVARSTAFSAVLLGNIAFVIDDILPGLNRRFAVTAGLLGACVAVIATIPLPALHLAPMGARETLLALAAGGLGLAPRLLPAYFHEAILPE